MTALVGPSNLPSEHLCSKELFVLEGHEGAILGVKFNTQGTYCLSCGKDRSIRLWNPHKGTAIKKYLGHGYEVRDVCVSGDNSKFASCGGDRQLFLWDVSSGNTIRKFRGHDSTINAVRYGANEEVLVTAGYDQSVRVWDCRSRSYEPIQIMRAFRDDVMAVEVGVTDIVAGSVDGTIKTFDIRMGRVVTDALHHAITSLAVSQDYLCVLAACLDSTLRLVDRGSGELLAQYRGHIHSSIRMDCALTPTDAHVIGSSEDGKMYYWDLVGQHLVGSFTAHSGPVTSFTMSPKGNCLVTASNDGQLKVWL